MTASGTVSRLITNITSTPVYNPNTKVRVGTNTSQTQSTTTSIMSVKQLVTVTAP